jgi:aubergine-like protein
MGHLKMKQIGQHFYNPQQRIKVPQHNLEIWPGYTTAVQDYEDGLYLVADVSHKIIPSRTCLELLYALKESSSDGASFKQQAIDALIGVVVLTPYNNRTYRVDDILWDLSPRNEFIYHNGEQCSYQDYYKYVGFNLCLIFITTNLF